MLKNIFFQIVSTLIAVAVLAYLVLHTLSGFENEISVKSVYYTTMELTYDSTAYIFRDEHVLTTEQSGDLFYPVNDGEKVAINEKVASIINDSSVYTMSQKLKNLQEKIEYISAVIEKANYSTTTVPVLDTNNEQRKEQVFVFSDDKNLENAQNAAQQSIFDTEVKYCVLNGTEKYEKLLKEYIDEKDELTRELKVLTSSTSNKSFSTPFSGYFYSQSDGYEEHFNFSAIENLSGESFEKLKDISPVYKNSVGKIAKNSKWYIAFELNSDMAVTISAGNKYSVYFPFSNRSINMKMEKRIDSVDEKKKIVVLSSSELYSDFNFSRKQSVSITAETFSGLAFPAAAVHTDYDSTGASKAGVYVLDETIVKFKTFDRLMEKNGYILCEVPDEKNISFISSTELSLFDNVIVEGTNLYHNKVIKNVLTAK